MLKLNQVIRELRAVGMDCRREECGDIRVTFANMPRNKAERAAYYTAELSDALATGLHMAGQRPTARLAVVRH